MKTIFERKTRLSVAAILALTTASSVAGWANDDLERALMENPTAPSISSTTAFLPPAAPSVASAIPNVGAQSGVYEKAGRVVVPNASVVIPKGEGYEALISANGQGLLVELGLCERDANGELVVGEDGTTKRRPLLRGLQVRKGDVLGKQKDAELVQQKIVAEQELLVARKEADKKLEIEVAEAAALVAQASYKRAVELNKTMPGSVSPEEVEEKRYEYVRALKSIDKAKFDLEVNVEKVKVAEARVNAAEVAIEDRKLISPIDGIVDDVMQNEGQWLREGDEILKIVRYDKVQINAAIPADRYAPETIANKKVVVEVKRPGGQPQKLEGKVVYVRQTVESGHYYFYADVANQKNEAGYWLLNPGALVTVEICVDEPAVSAPASAPTAAPASVSESSLTGSL
ncbi:MAG: HlyD family efflux transporter periplasmic adaptor subunit [Thermoguttaceae bacterium]|nr:HlyD family efflux transporter periplasmic adaptor subunit [Thermoguttaceae bacterium]